MKDYVLIVKIRTPGFDNKSDEKRAIPVTKEEAQAIWKMKEAKKSAKIVVNGSEMMLAPADIIQYRQLADHERATFHTSRDGAGKIQLISHGGEGGVLVYEAAVQKKQFGKWEVLGYVPLGFCADPNNAVERKAFGKSVFNKFVNEYRAAGHPDDLTEIIAKHNDETDS